MEACPLSAAVAVLAVGVNAASCLLSPLFWRSKIGWFEHFDGFLLTYLAVNDVVRWDLHM